VSAHECTRLPTPHINSHPLSVCLPLCPYLSPLSLFLSLSLSRRASTRSTPHFPFLSSLVVSPPLSPPLSRGIFPCLSMLDISYTNTHKHTKQLQARGAHKCRCVCEFSLARSLARTLSLTLSARALLLFRALAHSPSFFRARKKEGGEITRACSLCRALSPSLSISLSRYLYLSRSLSHARCVRAHSLSLSPTPTYPHLPSPCVCARSLHLSLFHYVGLTRCRQSQQPL
jgi:hypothetical protein